MKSLIGHVLQWWEGRTRREKRLLVIMCALLLGVMVWLGLIRPAMSWREGAFQRRSHAEATLADVQRDLSRLAPSNPPASARSAEGLEPLVRRTAEAAGLAVDLAMGVDGGLGVRLPAVASGAALGWLASLERDHRLRVCRLSVLENADATVNVEGTLSEGDCLPA